MHVKGKIQDFREKRQLNIIQIIVENDPNMELLRILTTISNHEMYDGQIQSMELPMKSHIPSDERSLSFREMYLDKKDAYITEKDLYALIFAWTREYSINGSFTFNQICKESKILELVQNFKGEDYDLCNTKIINLLRKCILELTRNGKYWIYNLLGLIVLVDEYNDVYSLVDDKEDLDQIVYNWLKEEECLDILISKLRESLKYQHSTRSRVKEAIGRLLQEGLVYEKSMGVYGCV